MGIHIKAGAFLLIASFIGGFIVDQKASAAFRPSSSGPDAAQQGDPEQSGGAEQKGQKQNPQVVVMMDGDGAGGGADKGEDGGSGKASAVGDGEDEDGNGKAAKVVKIDKKKKDEPSDGDGAEPVLDGAAAIDFLAGNSVKLESGGKTPHYLYYAVRGLLGESIDGGFHVRRWTKRGGELCTTGAEGSLDCKVIKASVFRPGKSRGKASRDNGKPVKTSASAPREGEAIGRIMVGSSTFTVVAGNVAKFPSYVPSLDPAREVKASAFSVVTPAGGQFAGRAAWEKIVGTPLKSQSAGSGTAPAHRPRITYYDPSGFLMEISRPTKASVETDLAIVKWTFRNNSLCLEAPKPPCLRPELSDGGISNLTDLEGETLSLSHPPAAPASVAVETLGAIHAVSTR